MTTQTRRRDDDDYLWDGTGEPDAEVVRLEALLGALSPHGALPPLPRAHAGAAAIRRACGDAGPASRRRRWSSSAMAAWFAYAVRQTGWTVQSLAGAPIVAGTRDRRSRAAADRRSRSPPTASSRARIDVGSIGIVDVEPNSRVRLIASRARRAPHGARSRPDPRADLGAAAAVLRQHAVVHGDRSRVRLHAAAWTIAAGARSPSRAGGWRSSTAGASRSSRKDAICATRPGRRSGHAVLRGRGGRVSRRRLRFSISRRHRT